MSHTLTYSPITTPTDVKGYAQRRYLNFDYEVRYTDVVLGEMIRAAQKEIEEQSGRLFNAQEVEEKWNGEDLNGGTLLQTKFYPILLMDSEGMSVPITLTIDGTEKTLDTDYYVTDSNTGSINTENYLPFIDYNNVVLEYTAGYDPAHPMAKALCEAMVVYAMYMERETPPSLQNVIEQQDTGVYNKGTDKMDKLVPIVFDITTRFNKLPKKLFLGIIEV
jgi:hypothetical protein